MSGVRVLYTGGLGARAQDMLESLAEWFYATEYISSVPLAFRDLRRRISSIFKLVYTPSVSLVITPLRLPNYQN